jgi:thiol-disulfide isomerase/thioredoxin
VQKKIILFIGFLILLFVLFGCNQAGTSNPFQKVEGNSICKQDGKPVIRLYSTTWCPRCKWIKPVFDEVAGNYAREGKIIAYHWQLDTNDDTLTAKIETVIPSQELSIFEQFSSDDEIPAFVFGCKYYRIGNGFEKQNNLDAERTEFARIIEEVLKEQ